MDDKCVYVFPNGAKIFMEEDATCAYVFQKGAKVGQRCGRRVTQAGRCMCGTHKKCEANAVRDEARRAELIISINSLKKDIE